MLGTDFKNLWIQDALEKIRLIFPDDDPEQIMKFLNKKYEKKFDDTECRIYNNYDKVETRTTVYNLINWLYDNKPILTESGSIFRQHKDTWNPDTMILANKLDERKLAKKDKFKYKNLANGTDDPDERAKYKELEKKADMQQARLKVIANSDYGVSGLSSSWCFNMACASATTAKGQALISTAFNAFEDFLSDSVLFTDMDECICFVKNILSEKNCRNKSDSKWVNDKSVDQVLGRLRDKFINKDDLDINIMLKILHMLDQEDLNRIYYKSNIYEFFRNSERAKTLLVDIISNEEEFMDPNNPNPSIKDDLSKLRDAVLEYVHYNYQFSDRVIRLRTSKRQTVTVIDTDSNFLNFGIWYDFVKEELLKMNEDDDLDEQDDFKILNSIINITTEMITRVLADFLRRCNVAEDAPGTTAMKNEFLYSTILITSAKKHYQAAIRLQEGNLIPPRIEENFDVKGMEYLKPSYAGEETRTFIQNLVYNDILMHKGSPDNVDILRKLNSFEESIIESILSGESKYLKTANVKTADAYKDPMSTGPYKAVYIWNSLFPDKAVELPGVAYLVPVKLVKPKDFAQLSVTDPELFEKLMYLFENNSDIKKSGITNIATPIDEHLPKSLEPYINLNDIVSKNLSLIFPVTDCIGIKTIHRTKSSEFFSNIIDI